MHILAQSGVWLVDSNGGEVAVMNEVESSLVSKVGVSNGRVGLKLEILKCVQ